MNENIDLTKILKDCPKGIKLYSTIHGEVTFDHINDTVIYPIVLRVNNNIYHFVTRDGKSLIESKVRVFVYKRNVSAAMATITVNAVHPTIAASALTIIIAISMENILSPFLYL